MLPDEIRISKKRIRSEDSTPENKGQRQAMPKRPKVQKASPPKGSEAEPCTSGASLSFANALTSVKVGVMLENYPEENLTKDQMDSIQKQILVKISEKEDAPYPQFSGISYRPGWLSITCDDIATAGWLKSTAGTLKPWDGAKLKAVDEADLPKSRILSVYLPNSKEDTSETILKLMKAQNPGLICKEWKILQRSNEGTAAHLILSVDLASVELLKKCSYKISYKFGKVVVYNKSEHKPTKKVETKTAKANKKPSVQPPNSSQPKETEALPMGSASTMAAKVQPEPSESSTSGEHAKQGKVNLVAGRSKNMGKGDEISAPPPKGSKPGKGKKRKPRKPKK